MFESETWVKYRKNASNSKGDDDISGKENHLTSQRAPTPQEGGEGIRRQGDHRWQSSKAALVSGIQLRKHKERVKKSSNYYMVLLMGNCTVISCDLLSF